MFVSLDGKVIADYNHACLVYDESRGYYYMDIADLTNLVSSKKVEEFNIKGDYHIEKMIECDDFMAPILSELNKRGYKTKYSCHGHISKIHSSIYGFEVSDNNYFVVVRCPYIMFDESVNSEEFDNFNVSGWHIEFENSTLRIYANRDSIEKAIDENDYDYYKFYGKLLELHSNLFNWVKRLPNYRSR